MPLFGSGGRHRKTATIGAAAVLGVAALTGGAIAISTGTGEAAESCAGLDTALRNNLSFIQGQQRNPDALSAARIANRQAVVDLIQQRRQTAGCTGAVSPEAPGQGGNAAPPPSSPSAAPAPGGAAGEVVCRGNTVTLSAEGGAPGATSNQFPVGTLLKVTNLDNNKSATVPVTGPSGSCALLNSSAFEQVREPGKFLIRRVVITRVR
ncbi:MULTISPECIES: septal ring lytic transglycosylase RlpA family protein [unclassified Crossiella]|uniref:septal ring lytic transglycosylase RlpA family protein n=1 Tax=unclassified Crossiella TaxID=2620835 RepID=UPI001FFFCF53|nr:MULTISPECIES: septal ring lytic transglycosylase RlpA family protein [unclassified Crossiella]MCK2241254.1 septal ring lytic transglycosylase RlpA family protein [Crossiella sp. S99.2]MCK2253602.1 septal ring lytic transglycosylase RlpA family protein [Crossiella sp. S99.1]